MAVKNIVKKTFSKFFLIFSKQMQAKDAIEMTDSKTNPTFLMFVQMPMTSITVLQCPDSLCYIP